MTPKDELRDQFAAEGRIWLRRAASDGDLKRLTAALPEKDRPGQRSSVTSVLGQAAARSCFITRISELFPGMRPVRIVAFSKTGSANWGVGWHQDRIIAVEQRTSIPGYGNWSRKGDIWHCEPPIELLRKMLFVRVHLDDSTRANGVMEIARGSHREGKVRTSCADEIAQKYDIELTEAQAGDVLILNMLTLHRSLPSLTRAARRVLRIDFADFDLPEKLTWAA